MLRKAGRLIPLAIVVFWLGMMAWLLWDEVLLPRRYPPMTSVITDSPRDLWVGLSMGDRRMGYMRWATIPEERAGMPGAELSLQARLRLPLGTDFADLELNGSGWLDATEGLREFSLAIRAAGYEMRVEGQVRDNNLLCRVITGESDMPIQVPVDRRLMLGGGFGLDTFALPQLEPGQTVYMQTMDPTTLSVGRAEIRALTREPLRLPDGSTVEALRVETSLGGFTTVAWVNERNEVLRAETPLGIVLERIEPILAIKYLPRGPGHKTDETSAPAEDVSAFSVPTTGPTPGRDAVFTRLRVGGVDPERIPGDLPWQRRTGDIIEITRPDPPQHAGNQSPAPDAGEFLRSDPFITADAPAIRQAAAVLSRTVDNPWDLARAINRWVYQEVKKERVITLPSAADVLKQRRGDCSEHSLLAVALLRAAGIPARVAVGIAWSDELKAFGYHAWVEAQIGGSWMPMDPTFGQDTADATHLKLLDGSIDAWTRLLRFAGKLRVEILDVSPAFDKGDTQGPSSSTEAAEDARL
ncbi:MAG: transglutaminase domain-containing protein [Candidatus Hydrogenedentes bacterium]|nr:transglutaminase domain-containing protein [Candidatus Hydrogenedentota bacterium]